MDKRYIWFFSVHFSALEALRVALQSTCLQGCRISNFTLATIKYFASRRNVFSDERVNMTPSARVHACLVPVEISPSLPSPFFAIKQRVVYNLAEGVLEIRVDA